MIAASPSATRLRRAKQILVVVVAILAFPVTIAIMYAASSAGRR